LPAGVAADRWNRKRLMIAADVIRAAVMAALSAAVFAGVVSLWVIIAAATVHSLGSAVFVGAEYGALRAVVPTKQLPDAQAAQTGRTAIVQLIGPPLGGALYSAARGLPFLIDALSYAGSTLSLLFMHTPFQEQRERDDATLKTRLAEGLRFAWDQPFLRTSALLFGLANFIGPVIVFALVVIGTRQGLSGGEIGGLISVFGACVLVGSFAARYVRRLLPPHAIFVLELWTWTGCAAFLIWPNVYVLATALFITGLVIPSTDSVVHSYRIAMTPDRLLGRAQAVWSAISLSIWPVGLLLAGALLDAYPARITIAIVAASALALAIWGSLSPSLRGVPPIKELADTPSALTRGRRRLA
jgi:MFS family permease